MITDMPKIHEDNDGARILAMSGMGQKRARHLSVKHHYVQDLCMSGELTVERIPSREQNADLLTKGSHTGEEHEHLQTRLGMVIYNRKMYKSGGVASSLPAPST